jgi:hypothetical protein
MITLEAFDVSMGFVILLCKTFMLESILRI